MAFPTIVDTQTSAETTDTLTHDIPFGVTAQANDILIAFGSIDGAPTITAPSGYNFPIQEPVGAGGNNYQAVMFWKRATGGETSTTCSTNVVERSVWRTWVIRGAHTTTNPEWATSTWTTSVNPDPPSLNPTGWNIEDTLWLAVASCANGTTTFTGFPTNYTNGISENSTGGGVGVSIGTARRENAVASEDPSTFTIDASRDWIASTIAIRPAPSGTPHTSAPSDSVNVADARSVSQGFGRPRADSAGVADSANRQAAYSRSATDSVSVADNTQKLQQHARSVSDTLTVADSRTLQKGYNRSASDSASVADNVTPTLSQIEPRSVSDSLSVADAPSRTATYVRSSAASLSVTDAAIRVATFVRTSADSTALADSASRTLSAPLLRSIGDALSVVDAATPLEGVQGDIYVPPNVRVVLLARPEAYAVLLAVPNASVALLSEPDAGVRFTWAPEAELTIS